MTGARALPAAPGRRMVHPRQGGRPATIAPPGRRPVSPITLLVFYSFCLTFVLLHLLLALPENPFPQLIEVYTLFAIALAPFAVAMVAKNPRAVMFFGLILAYFVALAISTLLHGNPFVSKWTAYGVDILVDSKIYLIALMLLAFAPPALLAKGMRFVLLGIVVIGLLNLPFILLDLVRGTSIWGVPLERRAGIPTPLGLFDLKVKSAQFQLLSMSAALALSLDPKANFRSLWLTLAGVFGFTLLIHLSIKEIVAGGIILILFTAFRGGRHPGIAAFTGIVLLALFLILATIDSPIKASFLERTGRFLGADRGSTVRAVAYFGSFQLSSEFFPFGSGASTFMSKGARDLAYSPYYVKTGIAYLWGGSPRYPMFLMDTFWPKILGQAGWLGLLAYAGAIIQCLLYSLKIYRRNCTPYTFGALAILTAIFVCSFATPTYTHDHLILPGAMAIAFVLSHGIVMRRRPQVRWQPQPVMRPQAAMHPRPGGQVTSNR